MESSGDLVTNSDSKGLGWGLGVFISNKFPGTAATASGPDFE